MNGVRLTVLDSKALTKVQSAALIAIIVVAAVGGSAGYVLWSASQPPLEDIRIGVCADLDMPGGKKIWQGAVLAAEQINAEGGVLGRNFTVVAEDDDSETAQGDTAVATNALTKLITVDKADYIISGTNTLVFQDICAEHKKILFGIANPSVEITQRVLDDYDRYKYFFRLYPPNSTTISVGLLRDISTLTNYTGFTKIALLFQDTPTNKGLAAGLNSSLPAFGLDIVYNGLFPGTTTDFASYFAAMEAAGAEMVCPSINGQAPAFSFVKEWYDRQSPFVVWGILTFAVGKPFYESTEGKCEFVSFYAAPALAGYPLTNKTLQTREAFAERWGFEVASGIAIAAYDGVRFILPDAIRRAGMTETEAVVKALELVDVETSMARHFVFTGSHDVMIGIARPNFSAADYMVSAVFQWQNGDQVPVSPRELMEEAGAAYKFPPWQGAWSD